MYKVLITDDERYVCEGLKNIFQWELFGFDNIYTASNGEEAIECIKTNCPDLVITDVRMPVMDGLQLARYINKFYPKIKMIFISAYDEFKYAKHAIDYGVKAYLLKPVEKEELKETIIKVVGNKNELTENDEDAVKNQDESTLLIKKVQQYIKNNCDKRITLEEAAKYVYISPQYLSKKFKEVTGENFIDYVLEVKIKRSKFLLRNSNMRVKDISVQLGFTDYTYFCKVFKKYENVTPLQYRAQFVMMR
ncbi:MAG: response regulator [Firmicutes bacterium]|nr:response regulator [Bacillota bacterium]